ncbi:MAG: ABC transporter ATP-binding protein [Candidatus Omnitrophica bacterium]|nr:ABC transporter ATP-binding protein [Candidatus Omnitrophota bacterium]MDD5026904.1 ABC transporter ATP-binding protein [Candidatus Omnitrophota bacterium]
MDDLIFSLRAVRFSYLKKYPALGGLDMDIARGQRIAILGANGSGKSTLLQLLDGLIFPDAGSVEAFGRRLDETALNNADFSRCFRSRVGLVFQNPDTQLFCPTVKEDILFGPLQLGLDKAKMNRRVDEVINSLGIGDLLERSPHQLSVGEKRKVSIATVLAIDPDVLLLDEPTAGLDPQTSRHIMDIIIEANNKGKTVITATHDLHIVEEIASLAYILNREKKIAKSGPVEELLNDLELLQANNLRHIHKHRHKDMEHIHSHQHTEHHL